jgi:lysozyme
MNLREQLIGFEDWVHKAYPDPISKGDPWTIGAGHTGPEVHEGLVWTDEQISAALDADIAEAVDGVLDALPWVAQLNEPRQAVLFGMAFQMGVHKLLEFHETLGAIRDQHFDHAANLLEQSLWAKQTPKRAKRLIRQLATGEWN